MKKFIALFGPLLLVVGFATPSIASAEYAVSQRTLAPFSGASTTLTPQQKSQVKAAVDSNPSGEKFICTGIRFESAPMSENIVVRKRAKSACDFAKTLNPALSTFYQNKPTKAKSYAGKVLLTVKTPIGASEVEQDIATPQPANEDQTPSAQSEQATSSQLNSLILSLKVESEYSSGYDRDLFKHWVDADGDGCDSREEVLIQESIAPVSIGTGCSISGGKWISSYDLLETTDPSTFDVDHMVPLKEAWDSGAWNWSMATRQAFANDLAFSHSLIAVSASSNRSKSDREPADWLPTNAEYV
ncbi:MAG: HNH endonuclease family protein, partial [Aquiluna sp.]|nr:HNH endonuclease family protein [Aquiluna sp.]